MAQKMVFNIHLESLLPNQICHQAEDLVVGLQWDLGVALFVNHGDINNSADWKMFQDFQQLTMRRHALFVGGGREVRTAAQRRLEASQLSILAKQLWEEAAAQEEARLVAAATPEAAPIANAPPRL